MKSTTTTGFRKKLKRLPKQARDQARFAYNFFKKNPNHPSLCFGKLGGHDDLWSARFSIHYRVVGIRDGNELSWFWIGTHSEFDNEFCS